MTRLILAAALCAMPVVTQAQSVTKDIVTGHILPRFETLADASRTLSQTAAKECRPGSRMLRSAYGAAFDAWVTASHLRFGPTEADDRAFALAFWPDSRGAAPRALATLLADEDPIAASPDSYSDVSVAARGFYALEFLIYDDALSSSGAPAYHCMLIRTISADIATTSAAILAEWQTTYAEAMLTPGADAIYRTENEALQELFKALGTGLQFTSDTRMGRPLGTFDRPRPTRAETRRSGRSAAHVALSLASLRDLAARLASGDAALAEALDARFVQASDKLTALHDPVFAGVSDPQTRFRIELVQQSIDAIRASIAQELGPTLGVAAGFNALDGD